MDATALLSLDSVLALLALTALEIVLGIDNIIFIAVLTGRVPVDRQTTTRNIGLGLAMLMRIVLLFSIFWVMRLTAPLFEIPFLTEVVGEGLTGERSTLAVSGRDLILVFGGLFLIGKATVEIHHLMEGPDGHSAASAGSASVGAVLI